MKVNRILNRKGMIWKQETCKRTKRIVPCILAISIVALVGCRTTQTTDPKEYTVQEPVKAFHEIQEAKIRIKKEERILEVLDGDTVVAAYRVGLGFEPTGDKKKEGDGKTTEGSYYVCTRNEKSKFHLSLGLSYPNEQDAKEALEEGIIHKEIYKEIETAITNKQQPPWKTPLGGEIMIHGDGSKNDWTAGCIAVENEVMDQLWDIVQMGTEVEIQP